MKLAEDIEAAMHRLDRAAGRMLERCTNCTHHTIEEWKACDQVHGMETYREWSQRWVDDSELTRAALDLLNRIRRR